MKVLFVYPNVGSQLGFNYGVSSLSALLKAAGHEVAFRQMCEDLGPLPSKDEFIAWLKDIDPDVIGFSVVTNQWPYARELAVWCREATSAPLVCGGIHATVAAPEILATGAFDYVFSGECEEAFPEFVNRLARREDVSDVRNLGRVVDGEIRINPIRPMPDLEALPPKDYAIFDFQRIIDAKNGWVGLMASRGCPFNCTYCFNHVMVKKYRDDLACSFQDLHYIRHHRVEQMIDEIVFLEKTYRNIKMFIFDDDLFTFDRDYVVRFCRAYRKVSSLPFVVNAHVGFFDEERARALAEANCKIVKVGIESGSERIRRQVMNRRTSNRRIVEVIRLIDRFGMHSSCFIMLGLPYEGRREVMETITLLGEAKPGRFRWTFFFPFPGTRAHDLSVEGGYVNFDRMGSLMNFTDESCLDFGPEHNLFLKKAGLILPWFVNAHAGLEVSPFYRDRVDALLKMDQEAFERAAPAIREEDREISSRFQAEGRTHYAIKYNPFMGVISDYFMRE
ncbi:MAG TPA: radical SAM protein [Syntrophales bacterium]|nr:radical SAM protein [Syntrophales bacterium]